MKIYFCQYIFKAFLLILYTEPLNSLVEPVYVVICLEVIAVSSIRKEMLLMCRCFLSILAFKFKSFNSKYMLSAFDALGNDNDANEWSTTTALSEYAHFRHTLSNNLTNQHNCYGIFLRDKRQDDNCF